MPTSSIESLHFQLRHDFQVVFSFMVVFWTLRCVQELRVTWRELVYASKKHPIFDYTTCGQTEGPDSCDDDDDSDEASTMFDGVQKPDAKDIQPAWKMSVWDTRLIKLMLYTRLFIALALLVDGYILLCVTQTVIELILNAVALEFIFTIGEFVDGVALGDQDPERVQVSETGV